MVRFSSGDDPEDDLKELVKAVKSAFGLQKSAKLLLQSQSDPDFENKWFDVSHGIKSFDHPGAYSVIDCFY